MKCNELMVGDWITDEYKLPMQIYRVDEGRAYADSGCTLYEFNKDYPPQPIGITRDILKKNGWMERPLILSWDSSVLTYYFVKDEGDIHLEYKCTTLTIWFNYKTGYYFDITIPVIYVHQLQQILRLAGMTDIANNFKMQ